MGSGLKSVIRPLGFFCALILWPLLCHAIEVVEETGSLRNFIGGHEPGCAYDNYISHTVERTGNYDQGPPELDAPAVGFGNITLATETDCRILSSGMLALWENNVQAACDTLAQMDSLFNASWQLVRFHDTDFLRDYWMLREKLDSCYTDSNFWAGPDDDVVGSFNFGWGLYVIRPEAGRNSILIEAPHPGDDFISTWIAADFFLGADAGLLFMNGACRFFPNSQSDPTRNRLHPANDIVNAVRQRLRLEGEFDFSMQVHSFDDSIHAELPDIVLSCARWGGCIHPPVFDFNRCGRGMLNLLANPTFSAGDAWWIENDVSLQSFVSVHTGYPMIVGEGGEADSLVRPMDLWGYIGNNSMLLALEGLEDCGEPEHFLHIELAEEPHPAEMIGETALYHADSARVPTWSNFADIIDYYRPMFDSLRVAYDHLMQWDCEVCANDPGWNITWTSDTSLSVTWLNHSSSFGLETQRITGHRGWLDSSGEREVCSNGYWPGSSVSLSGVPGEMLTLSLEALDATCDTIACSDTLRIPLPYREETTFSLGLQGQSGRMIVSDADAVIQVRVYNSIHQLDFSTLMWRVDVNGDGLYLGTSDDWRSCDYTGLGYWKLCSLPLQAIADGSRFELRVHSNSLSEWDYSGRLAQCGIDDDWYVWRDTESPAPPMPVLMTQTNERSVLLSWACKNGWPADFNGVEMELLDADTGELLRHYTTDLYPQLLENDRRSFEAMSFHFIGRRLRATACALDRYGHRSLSCCSNTIQMTEERSSRPTLLCAYEAPDFLRLQWSTSSERGKISYQLYCLEDPWQPLQEAALLLETEEICVRLRLDELPASGAFFRVLPKSIRETP